MAGRPRRPPGENVGPVVRAWAARFEARLDELELSIDDVAAALDAARSTVEAWRRGDNVPPIERWPRLAEVLRYERTTDLFPPGFDPPAAKRKKGAAAK